MFEIKHVPAAHALIVTQTTTPETITPFIGEAISNMHRFITRNILIPVGAPRALYYGPLPARVDVCFPIETASGSIAHPTTVLPACAVVYRLVSLRVANDGLGPIYEAGHAWAKERGYLPDGPVQELYLAPRHQITLDDPYIEVRIPIRTEG